MNSPLSSPLHPTSIAGTNGVADHSPLRGDPGGAAVPDGSSLIPKPRGDNAQGLASIRGHAFPSGAFGDEVTVVAINAPGQGEELKAGQAQLERKAPPHLHVRRGTALVLGGGGSAGNAWEIGVIAGQFDAGLDVTRADLIIGTSAGSTTAAQITSTAPTDLFAAILAAAPPQRSPVGSGAGGRAPAGPVNDHMERTGRIIAAAEDAADMRRRMGAAALELDAGSDGSWSARWRAIVGARFSNQSWPEQAVLITAVDARTGRPVEFDRNSGVDLVDAVAASTSSGLPYRIGDHRFIDGGYRRNENADLAADYARVLVLSPLGGRTRHPMEWGLQLAAQVDDLRAGGSSVETILPDGNSLSAFGANLMDGSTRSPAAQAGYNQGKALAAYLADFWR